MTRGETTNDPYKGYRDDKGRFIKGNPGGPGRQKEAHSWLTEIKFRDKHPFLLIPHPGRCPQCKHKDYLFQLRLDSTQLFIVRCRCQNCGSERYYSPFNETWG